LQKAEIVYQKVRKYGKSWNSGKAEKVSQKLRKYGKSLESIQKCAEIMESIISSLMAFF